MHDTYCSNEFYNISTLSGHRDREFAWWEVRTLLGVVDLTVIRLSDSNDISVISISMFRVND